MPIIEAPRASVVTALVSAFSLVAERALFFDADEAMNIKANSVCGVLKGSFAFRCSCLDYRLSHRHGI